MTADFADVGAAYRKHRLRVMLAITLGYGFIYTCRLGLNIVKKPLIDNGIFTVDELGVIGAALYYGYAAGKLVNGFAADHFRPRVFFSVSILVSALLNLVMGWSSLLWLSITIWILNGWFQGMAAPAAVISITNWFSISERGRSYGIWSSSHAIGEGLTYYGIAAVVAAWGWQYGFITPGILCIGVAAWAYAFLRDAPKTMGLPDVHEFHGEEPEPLQYPGQALAVELYIEAGIRSVEIGTVMFGADPHTGEERPARLDLLRLAIPRRVYTQSHMDYVLEAIGLIWERRGHIRGMRIVRAPRFLRHFTAEFEWV